MGKKMKKPLGLTALVVAVSLCLSACGGSSSSAGGGGDSIKVIYQKTDQFTQFDAQVKKAKKIFEKEHPGKKVDLQPISAQESDYKTKLSLAQRSPATAPDVLYQDSDSLQADADAGYLYNIKPFVDKWEDWNKNYIETAKKIGTGRDGVYGVPADTDTRVIWYNKHVFEKAGIPIPWQPHTWQDLLVTAATIKAKVPGVVPMNMFAGTAIGEGTSMQSFYQLLYGTKQGNKALMDIKTGKWTIGSQGFKDSLNFLKTIYDKGYAPTPAQAQDVNIGGTISMDWLPNDKIGFTLDGSWLPSTWIKGGSKEWPDYEKTLGAALFPSKTGAEPQYVTSSGGWTLAVGGKSRNPELAFEFIKLLGNREFSLEKDIKEAKIAVRSDVAKDPKYLATNAFTEITTKALTYTHVRPSVSEYPKVSAEIQKATEQVVTGAMSVDEAAKAYDQGVTGIVGQDKVAIRE